MDNSQILTIALAAAPNMLAVLAGILINNSSLVPIPTPPSSETYAAIWMPVSMTSIADSTKCATSGALSFTAWSK